MGLDNSSIEQFFLNRMPGADFNREMDERIQLPPFPRDPIEALAQAIDESGRNGMRQTKLEVFRLAESETDSSDAGKVALTEKVKQLTDTFATNLTAVVLGQSIIHLETALIDRTWDYTTFFGGLNRAFAGSFINIEFNTQIPSLIMGGSDWETFRRLVSTDRTFTHIFENPFLLPIPLRAAFEGDTFTIGEIPMYRRVLAMVRASYLPLAESLVDQPRPSVELDVEEYLDTLDFSGI